MKKHAGYGMVEIMIVITAVALASVGILRFYESTNTHANAKIDADIAVGLTEQVAKAYLSGHSNFLGLSNQFVSENNLGLGSYPITVNDEGKVLPTFGGEIDFTPHTIRGVPGKGFAMRYSTVPDHLCSSFVQQVADRVDLEEVYVGNRAMMGQGSINKSTLLEACKSSKATTVAFIAGADITLPDATYIQDTCTVPSPSVQTKHEACPSGMSGVIEKTRTASCGHLATLPSWSEWVEVSNTCKPVCTTNGAPPKTKYHLCPDGQVGHIKFQSESVCTGSTGHPSWSGWVEVENTCQDACVSLAPTYTTQTREVACPAGTSPRHSTATGLIWQKRHIKEWTQCTQATGEPDFTEHTASEWTPALSDACG